MSEVVFANRKFISTGRASKLSGYSQDYLGQLCRAGSLECKMISDQWYLIPDSLRKLAPDMVAPSTEDYADFEDSEQSAGDAPQVEVADVRTGAFKYGDEDYIPTQKAAEISGYTQDYIGQLARSGEILAKKVGRRWFIERNALEQHRDTKDGLLRAVQADASGVAVSKQEQFDAKTNNVPINANFTIKYFSETGEPLIPKPKIKEIHNSVQETNGNGKSVDVDTDISAGRFGALNTGLGSTISPKTTIKALSKQPTSVVKPLVAPKVAIKEQNLAKSINNYSKIEQTNSPSVSLVQKILLIVLSSVLLASVISLALLYFGLVNKDDYVRYVPGHSLNYSN